MALLVKASREAGFKTRFLHYYDRRAGFPLRSAMRVSAILTRSPSGTLTSAIEKVAKHYLAYPRQVQECERRLYGTTQYQALEMLAKRWNSQVCRPEVKSPRALRACHSRATPGEVIMPARTITN